jgi:hypothetical protein
MGTETDEAISVLVSETTGCLYNIYEPKINAQVSTKEKYRCYVNMARDVV